MHPMSNAAHYFESERSDLDFFKCHKQLSSNAEKLCESLVLALKVRFSLDFLFMVMLMFEAIASLESFAITANGVAVLLA